MRFAVFLSMMGLMAFSPVQAASVGSLQVSVEGAQYNKPLPDRFAYCVSDEKNKKKEGQNINPSVSWSGAPEGTRSFALIVVDRDVPKTFELANQPDKTIPKNFPRQDFYHWVLVDIPPSMVAISEGADSRGVIPGGKPVGKVEYGVNGQNDYARFSEDAMHGGYDGPCPPWNDQRLHRYHFIVYALDVETLGLSGNFTGQYAESLIKQHTLAKGEFIGTYALYPYAR